MKSFTIEQVKKEIIGNEYFFETPYGKRLLTYADYTASGRNISFIEKYLLNVQESYANTHTEDDMTGKSMTELLNQAIATIKRLVNANENNALIFTGTGSTGAIHHFQNILGVYISPVAKEKLFNSIGYLNDKEIKDLPSEAKMILFNKLYKMIEDTKPVVFISPYEHHSNEVTWRECFVDVVKIRLTSVGDFDLDDLEKKVSDDKYKNRFKICTFSAASNITGLTTPVYEIAKVCHKYDCLVCIDYAASAPYVEISMNKDEESYLDAVFLSPHKFLGGPGSAGVLIFNKRHYRKDLPPVCSGGGTVDYVVPQGHDFVEDIETRESAGTPGTLQIIKTALAMELKSAIGIKTIEAIENKLTTNALGRLQKHPQIEILGNTNPKKRLAIISFNIRHKDLYIHPKLVTRLLNDLFGIQSRAGCSCAGPYGHYLLGIGYEASEEFRETIRQGCNGLKPGWARVNFHYTFDDDDYEFICKAIEFIADNGYLFIPKYTFNLKTGAWKHEDEKEKQESFGIEHAYNVAKTECKNNTNIDRKREYDKYLREAYQLAEEMKTSFKEDCLRLPSEQKTLCRFYVCNMA